MPLLTSGGSSVTTANIVDGTIVNADISPSAAIALSKLSGAAASGANSDITSLSALSTPLSEAQGGSGRTSLLLQSNGATTKNLADASATQTIAHGLGVTPKRVRITVMAQHKGTVGITNAYVVYNGTTQAGSGLCFDGTTETAIGSFRLGDGSDNYSGVVTFDSTNISIAWTKGGNMSGTGYITWEAEA